MQRRALITGVVVASIVLALSAHSLAAPQAQARSVISYPTDGLTVSGVVEVRGIAAHPSINMYQIRYAAGSEPTGGSQWVDFAIVQGAQVEDDVLGRWDTTLVPDGVYTLALAVWGNDDGNNPYVFFVKSLTVNNAQPAASPTPVEVTATPEPISTVAAGPTPTQVPVVQPATSTPRSSPTPRAEVAGASESSDEGEGSGEPRFALDVEGLRTAFFGGGLVVIMLLLLWGLYLLAKASVRWYLRGRARRPSR